MTDLLDPKNDYVFKRLFADAPTLSAAMINAVRHRAPPITVVQVRNPAIDPEDGAAERHSLAGAWEREQNPPWFAEDCP